MKVLHTSDWHLGKYLEKYSRLEEQEKFIDELEEICNNENIDLIIIAGDIYDTTNPPILAEKLFFNAMKRLSLNGKRPIVIISGNHDSGTKITSPKPLANEFGIILQGDLKSVASVGKYESFEITKSGEFFFEIILNDERAVFLTMPYLTEKSLNEVIFDAESENENQKNFSDKVKEIFENNKKHFKEDTINIIVAHMFVKGGIETDSERKIQTIGGAYAVSPEVFPENADYVALGHLHKLQRVKEAKVPTYYSGSPIRYSQSEIDYQKAVLIIDITKSSKDLTIKKHVLKDYKPIYVFKCKTYQEAFEKCQEVSYIDSFVFIEIFSNSPLDTEQIRDLRAIKKDIVSIIVKFQENEKVIYEIQEQKNILENFKDFYFDTNNILPKDELLDIFLELVEEIDLEEEKKEVDFNETIES